MTRLTTLTLASVFALAVTSSAMAGGIQIGFGGGNKGGTSIRIGSSNHHGNASGNCHKKPCYNQPSYGYNPYYNGGVVIVQSNHCNTNLRPDLLIESASLLAAKTADCDAANPVLVLTVKNRGASAAGWFAVRVQVFQTAGNGVSYLSGTAVKKFSGLAAGHKASVVINGLALPPGATIVAEADYTDDVRETSEANNQHVLLLP
jgi:hypothetical protein